jgi:hypothetical protein
MAGQEAAELARSLVSGSGAASRIAVAGMPAPPTAPATSADHRHDPCQASSQGCPNERADYLFGMAQAALWATSMPTIRRILRTRPQTGAGRRA